MSSDKKKINVGILTSPISISGTFPLSNLIDVITPSSNNIYLITGNVGHIFFKNFKRSKIIQSYGIEHTSSSGSINRIIKYMILQLKLSYLLAKLSRRLDVWIFSVGGDCLVLPALTAKLLRKNIILVLTSSSLQTHISSSDNLSKLIEFVSVISYNLMNKIIVYSPNIINIYNLTKYTSKIIISHEHFINLDSFCIKKQIRERDNVVGYIGRFSQEKGILNFVRAIPEVLKLQPNTTFFIGGDGKLRDQVKIYLDNNNLKDKVKLVGWIPHNELPGFFNELKLIVLPSYTEGLPNIMLEAMACGTPVLATSVGSIPDIIEDKKNGFIMRNNSSECIAESITRVLENSSLDKIVESSRALIEREFTYEAAVERYKSILEMQYDTH